MKIEFDRSKILARYTKDYEDKLEAWLLLALDYIDTKTPIDTWDLILHNKISKVKKEGMSLEGWVYNDLWDYEQDVERGMGTPFTYHQLGKPMYDNKRVWAWMFRDWFAAAKDILLELLR